jgi:starch synthase
MALHKTEAATSLLPAPAGAGAPDERAEAPSDPSPDRRRADALRPRLLFVTSEIADYLKVGGLGEVSASLPRALAKVSDARVLVPGYRAILARHPDMRILGRLPGLADIPPAELGEIVTADGLRIHTVLSQSLFDRAGSAYGDESGAPWEDNDLRFARLALAAAQMARGLTGHAWRPDILHLNDWPSALAAGYLEWQGIRTPSILTVHNLAYQGNFARERMESLAIPRSAFSIDGVEFHGQVSFLKAGLYYASQITTVSGRYAEEITTPDLGCGLDGLLRARRREGRLSGILNGIDESWHPRTDPSLPHPFDASDLSGKQSNAQQLREQFGLAVTRGPLFAVVSRLVHQKGLDLTLAAMESIVRDGGQLMVIGTGDAEMEQALQETATRLPGSVAVRIGYEEPLARRIFAASDFLLMPSRFEPCGLSQMYAQRFASLPIAHNTGGLGETIEDGATGFLFNEARRDAFESAIQRAKRVFDRKEILQDMRRRAMNRTFGWGKAVGAYMNVYRLALGASRQWTV